MGSKTIINISIDPQLELTAKKNAEKQKRNLSNYISWLIVLDNQHGFSTQFSMNNAGTWPTVDK